MKCRKLSTLISAVLDSGTWKEGNYHWSGTSVKGIAVICPSLIMTYNQNKHLRSQHTTTLTITPSKEAQSEKVLVTCMEAKEYNQLLRQKHFNQLIEARENGHPPLTS